MLYWASFGAEQSYSEGSTARRGLFKSKEYGKDWELLTQGLPIKRDEAIRFYGLSLDINSPKDNRILYVTIKGNVYKSIDDGSSWKMIFLHGGLKFTEVDRFDSNLIYAGANWKQVNENMAWNYAGKIEVERGDNPNVWVWSPGTGVEHSLVP